MSEDSEMALAEADEAMTKALSYVKSEFASVRSGRAAPQLIESLTAEAYGVPMKVQELASVSIPESRQLLVSPHDASNLEAIEKAIMASDLGLTPNSDGKVIRLNFPPLTEERRLELVKLVKGMGEDGRVRLRNVRRDTRKDLESLKKNGNLGDDELERAEKELDTLIQNFEVQIDTALNSKEAELLEV